MVLCALVGCHRLAPLSALASSIPLDLTNEKLTYLGDVAGRACQTNLFYVIPLEPDASIFTAKADAMKVAARQYGSNAVGLVDVSIDIESRSYIVYDEQCTVIRGKAVGYASESRAAAERRAPSDERHAKLAAPVEPAKAETPSVQHTGSQPTSPLVDLAQQTPRVVGCLADADAGLTVSVKVRVSRHGKPLSLAFGENPSRPAMECILGVLKTVAYPRFSTEYVVEHTYLREL
jgi:hypothetical protein